MNIYAVVARRLRLKRLEAGLTIEDLADAAGISVSFLAYLEANKKKPSLDTLSRIAAALKIQVSELFDERNVPEAYSGKQKTFNRLLKLLRGQSPESTEIILAAAAVLAKKLSAKRT